MIKDNNKMKKVITKISSIAMAFTLLGTGTAITTTISPKSDNALIANASYSVEFRSFEAKNYYYSIYYAPYSGWCYGIGNTSRGVQWIQAAINWYFRWESKNPVLSVDGVYGQNTAKWVREFQKRNKLSADGIYGPNTHRVMQNYIKNHPYKTTDTRSR